MQYANTSRGGVEANNASFAGTIRTHRQIGRASVSTNNLFVLTTLFRSVGEYESPYVGGTVAPGTPPLGQPPGLTVSPRVGTVHAGVSRPRVGREAPGWGGPSWREPPRGGA